MNFREREVDIYHLPLPTEAPLLHPEKALIVFDGSYGSLDLGALCYIQRSSKRRKNSNQGKYFGCQVNHLSLTESRVEIIREVISLFSQQVTIGRKRIGTVYTNAQAFIKFMDWADANKHTEALNDRKTASNAFKSFVAHLHEQVNRNLIARNQGANTQNRVLNFLNDFLGVQDIHRGINLLRRNINSVENTEPPSDNEQAKVLSLCETLFNGLAELVIDQREFPFCLRMPKYLDWSSPDLWIFPIIRWCIPPHALPNRAQSGQPNWAYDFANGRLAREDEIEHHYSVPVTYRGLSSTYRHSAAKNAIRIAKAKISEANSDRNHWARREAAMLAHNAFVQLFVATTGLNFSVVAELPWSGDYLLTPTRQGFRAVKWRAGGRIVSIEISVDFLPIFKRYIQLRIHLLRDIEHEYLFLSFGVNANGYPKKIHPKVLDGLYVTLANIDPTIEPILGRRWRAGKGDWLLRMKDISTTSDLLQNSPETVTKHYSAGSINTATSELTTFFNRVSDAALRGVVLAKGECVPSSQNAPLGICIEFGIPKKIEEGAPVEPDCKHQEGCLFCNKYRIHADERDTRKILSCRHCIEHTLHLPGAAFFFESILERIDLLLSEIDLRNGHDGMVAKIRREVDEGGHLDAYWARKLELLINLDIVAA